MFAKQCIYVCIFKFCWTGVYCVRVMMFTVMKIHIVVWSLHSMLWQGLFSSTIVSKEGENPTEHPVSWLPRALHQVSNPLGLLSCGYQELFTVSVAHLLPVLWIQGSLHSTCDLLGFLPCRYQDIFSVSVAHLAPCHVDTNISLLHL